jgi:hypothetical protein
VHACPGSGHENAPAGPDYSGYEFHLKNPLC